MNNNVVLQFLITAKDMTQAALGKMKNSFKNFATGVGRNFANIYFAFSAVIRIAQTVARSISSITKEAIKIEAAIQPFERFLGTQGALKHIRELQKISATGVFNADELIQSSTELIRATEGYLGTIDFMKKLADTSAETGVPLKQLTDYLSMFYVMLSSGQPITRYVAQLARLNIITAQEAIQMKYLYNNGKQLGKIWAILENSMERLKGGVEKSSKEMGKGLNALSESWTRLKEQAGWEILEATKEQVKALTEKLIELRESGKLKEWAEEALAAVQALATGLQNVGKFIGNLPDIRETIPDLDLLKKKTAEHFATAKPYEGGVGQFIEGIWKSTVPQRVGQRRSKTALIPEVHYAAQAQIMKQQKEDNDHWNAIENAVRAEEEAKKARQKKISDLEKEKELTEENAKLEQKKLGTLEEQSKARAESLRDSYVHNRTLALSEKAREAEKRSQQASEKSERKYQSLLQSASRKMRANMRRHSRFGIPLSEAERAAVSAENARIGAGQAEEAAKQFEQRALQAEIDTAETLKKIEGELSELLTMQEGA